VLGNKCRGFS